MDRGELSLSQMNQRNEQQSSVYLTIIIAILLLNKTIKMKQNILKLKKFLSGKFSVGFKQNLWEEDNLSTRDK